MWSFADSLGRRSSARLSSYIEAMRVTPGHSANEIRGAAAEATRRIQIALGKSKRGRSGSLDRRAA